MALSYFVGTATQGSNDAFVEAEIATALSSSGRAARVREILFDIPVSGAAGAEIQACISRRSQAAYPLITDRNVIAAVHRSVVMTTSGQTVQDRLIRYTFSEDDELLVVEDPLYLDVDSASTSAQNTIYVRIGYELVNINANERLALALQSLNEST